MTKKRSSSAADAGSSSPSLKKRKVENVQKFYAVKAGAVPGVYLDYADCQAQTAGFRGALCEYLIQPDYAREPTRSYCTWQRRSKLAVLTSWTCSQIVYI